MLKISATDNISELAQALYEVPRSTDGEICPCIYKLMRCSQEIKAEYKSICLLSVKDVGRWKWIFIIQVVHLYELYLGQMVLLHLRVLDLQLLQCLLM